MSEALAGEGVALRADALIALRRVALAAAPDPVLAALPGGIATRRIGHGLEVADTREYIAGDDIRHLDRGTTARTGRLHVRRFQEERDRVTLLVADLRPGMFWGLKRAFRSVAAAEALAMIGWHVVETGGRVGLLAVTAGDAVIVPVRGRVRGMLDVIGGLVEAHESALADLVSGSAEADAVPLVAGLGSVERLAPAGAEVVIASGFDHPGAGLADRLDALARRRHPRLIEVVDGAAERLPAGRYPVRLEDGRRLRLRAGGGRSDDDGAGGAPVRQVAGKPALRLDAGDPVERLARQLSAGFQMGRAA